MMTRHCPLADMEFWLDYQFHIGICHIFLRIQNTPRMVYLLSQAKYSGRISPVSEEETSVFMVDVY